MHLLGKTVAMGASQRRSVIREAVVGMRKEPQVPPHAITLTVSSYFAVYLPY